MKRILLISILFLSGCTHYRCHDAINCHWSNKKHDLSTTPKVFKENNVSVRGEVYVDELY